MAKQPKPKPQRMRYATANRGRPSARWRCSKFFNQQSSTADSSLPLRPGHGRRGTAIAPVHAPSTSNASGDDTDGYDFIQASHRPSFESMPCITNIYLLCYASGEFPEKKLIYVPFI